MRSFIAASALVALVSAAPLLEERDQVTVTEVTDVYTTVWDDEPAAAATTISTTLQKWYYKSHSKKPAEPVTTVVVSPTSTPEAAPTTLASSTPVSTYVAPVSTYVAPVATTAAPVATTPVTSSTAAAATVASSNTGSSYSDKVVRHHNLHRANHSAPALSWSDDLAATALTIANSCNYAHDTTTNGGGYGQNIAAGCPADNITSVITDLFYNGEVNFFTSYGQATPSDINTDNFDKYGHFTQIVWKDSTQVGCATVDCTGKGNGPQGLGNVDASVPPIFTVCNYKSAGNFLGEFDTNVLPSIGEASISWAT